MNKLACEAIMSMCPGTEELPKRVWFGLEHEAKVKDASDVLRTRLETTTRNSKLNAKWSDGGRKRMLCGRSGEP